MLVCAASSALALSVFPGVDKTAVSAGEDVTVTLSLDEALKAVNTMAIRVYFDDTLFEKKSYEALDSGISGLTSTVKTDDNGKYITLNYLNITPQGGDIAAGEFCKITFTAKGSVSEEAAAAFGSMVQTLGFADGHFGDKTDFASISVSVKPTEDSVSVNLSALPENGSWTMKAGENRNINLAELFTDSNAHLPIYSFSVTDSSGNPYSNAHIHISQNAATASMFTFSTPDPGSYTVELRATCPESGKTARANINVTVEAAADGLPIQYGYDETPAKAVTVFATISSDGIPIVGNDAANTTLSHLEVTVPYFDLALYGLEDYYRYATANGSGAYVGNRVIERPTAMHLFIYMLERYYFGLPEEKCGKGTSGVLDGTGGRGVVNMRGETAYNDDVCSSLSYTGGATSTYMKQVWGHDENLMYYRNHAYPLQSPGWGSTSDYILLSDGDTIDMAMFTNWSFYQYGAFCTFVNRDTSLNDGANNGDHTDVNYRPGTAFTAKVGERAVFSAVKFGTQATSDGGTDDFASIEGDKYAESLNVAVYDEKWRDITDSSKVREWTDDGKGHYTVTFAEPGTYYLLGIDANAGRDEDGKSNACIAPATAKIIVSEAEEPEPIPGDVNGDGDVTAQDVQRIRNYLLGKLTLTEKELAIADINRDGDVTAQDVQRLRNYLLGKLESLT